jgi:hypothetical protein
MLVCCHADEGDLTWSRFSGLARPAQIHRMVDKSHIALSGLRIAFGGLASLQLRSGPPGPPDLRPIIVHDRMSTGLVRLRQHQCAWLPAKSQHDDHSTVHPGTQPRVACGARPKAAACMAYGRTRPRSTRCRDDTGAAAIWIQAVPRPRVHHARILNRIGGAPFVYGSERFTVLIPSSLRIRAPRLCLEARWRPEDSSCARFRDPCR